MPVYDKQEYLDAYHRHGEMAPIHLPMLGAFSRHHEPGTAAMDLGSSVGLLPQGLLQLGASEVYCFEGHPKSLVRAIRTDRTHWHEVYVTPQTLGRVLTTALYGKVKTVTARRVLYEIEKTQDGMVAELGRGLFKAGVERIILQGCVPVKNPQVKLHQGHLEAAALQDSFLIQAIYGPVYVLTRRPA